MAWAFTSLSSTGYPQYLGIRRRSKLSTFSFCIYSKKNIILKQNDYEETATITCYDVTANDSNSRHCGD